MAEPWLSTDDIAATVGSPKTLSTHGLLIRPCRRTRSGASGSSKPTRSTTGETRCCKLCGRRGHRSSIRIINNVSDAFGDVASGRNRTEGRRCASPLRPSRFCVQGALRKAWSRYPGWVHLHLAVVLDHREGHRQAPGRSAESSSSPDMRSRAWPARAFQIQRSRLRSGLSPASVQTGFVKVTFRSNATGNPMPAVHELMTRLPTQLQGFTTADRLRTR